MYVPTSDLPWAWYVMVCTSLTLDDLTSLLDLLSASAAMGTVSPGTKAVRGSVSVAEMGPL